MHTERRSPCVLKWRVTCRRPVIVAVIPLNMPDPNPYSSPWSVGSTKLAAPLPAYTRWITWLTISLSIFALLATYGYPSRMTPFWYFVLLPSLALLTITLTSIALGRRSNSESFSMVPAIGTLTIVLFFALIIVALSRQSGIYLMDVTPRLAATAIGWAAATAITAMIHGSTVGRRGLVFANGMAILQATTSIAETISLGLGPW